MRYQRKYCSTLTFKLVLSIQNVFSIKIKYAPTKINSNLTLNSIASFAFHMHHKQATCVDILDILVQEESLQLSKCNI